MRLQNSFLSRWLVLSFVIGILGITFMAFRPQKDASTSQAYGTTDWRFWKYEHLKLLDPWGDSDGDVRDVAAIYVKEGADTLHFRVDLMDLRQDSTLNVYFAIDYKFGGNTELIKGNQYFVSDISWDLLFVLYDSSQQAIFDTTYIDHPDYLAHAALENQLDFVEFSILKTAFAGWDGKPFQVQAIITRSNSTLTSDKTTPASTDATTGRAKFVTVIGNNFGWATPDGITWYDGFDLDAGNRPGERRGSKYLLDAVEQYEQPLTIGDLFIDNLPRNEYWRINDRLRSLASKGLLDPFGALSYGYFMPWQPADVDSLAIQVAKEYRNKLDLPQSQVFCPYENMLTVGDLETIKQAGYPAIYGREYGRYFGWITDWSNAAAIRERIELEKKIHIVNGVKLFTDNGHSYGGWNWDPRWKDPIPSVYDRHTGTDRGLHLWWRRELLNLALDPDQEKYVA